jgi:hypothetical protein
MVRTVHDFRWRDLSLSHQLELGELVEHYAQTKRAEGRSIKTITGYTRILNAYISYLVGQDVPPSCRHLHLIQ